MLMPARLKIADINRHLVCVLCGGYLVDATTIIECVHSFCRSCIIRYLESSKYCPICDVQVHRTKPLDNLRPDKCLQDLVYKLVPGLYKDEMCRRRTFFKNHPDARPKCTEGRSEEMGEVSDCRYGCSEGDKISLVLQHCDTLPSNRPSSSRARAKDEKACDKRYLLCPASFSISHIKKFIKYKFDLGPKYAVQVYHTSDTLQDDFTLGDISHIYNWRKMRPLKLQYTVLEDDSPVKNHITTNVILDRDLAISDGADEQKSISQEDQRADVSINPDPQPAPEAPCEESAPMETTPEAEAKAQTTVSSAEEVDDGFDSDGGMDDSNRNDVSHEKLKQDAEKEVVHTSIDLTEDTPEEEPEDEGSEGIGCTTDVCDQEQRIDCDQLAPCDKAECSIASSLVQKMNLGMDRVNNNDITYINKKMCPARTCSGETATVLSKQKLVTDNCLMNVDLKVNNGPDTLKEGDLNVKGDITASETDDVIKSCPVTITSPVMHIVKQNINHSKGTRTGSVQQKQANCKANTKLQIAGSAQILNIAQSLGSSKGNVTLPTLQCQPKIALSNNTHVQLTVAAPGLKLQGGPINLNQANKGSAPLASFVLVPASANNRQQTIQVINTPVSAFLPINANTQKPQMVKISTSALQAKGITIPQSQLIATSATGSVMTSVQLPVSINTGLSSPNKRKAVDPNTLQTVQVKFLNKPVNKNVNKSKVKVVASKVKGAVMQTPICNLNTKTPVVQTKLVPTISKPDPTVTQSQKTVSSSIVTCVLSIPTCSVVTAMSQGPATIASSVPMCTVQSPAQSTITSCILPQSSINKPYPIMKCTTPTTPCTTGSLISTFANQVRSPPSKDNPGIKESINISASMLTAMVRPVLKSPLVSMNSLNTNSQFKLNIHQGKIGTPNSAERFQNSSTVTAPCLSQTAKQIPVHNGIPSMPTSQITRAVPPKFNSSVPTVQVPLSAIKTPLSNLQNGKLTSLSTLSCLQAGISTKPLSESSPMTNATTSQPPAFTDALKTRVPISTSLSEALQSKVLISREFPQISKTLSEPLPVPQAPLPVQTYQQTCSSMPQSIVPVSEMSLTCLDTRQETSDKRTKQVEIKDLLKSPEVRPEVSKEQIPTVQMKFGGKLEMPVVMPVANHSMTKVMPVANHSMTKVMPEANHSMTKVMPEANHSMTKVMPEANHSMTKVMPEANHSMTKVMAEANHSMTKVMLEANHSMTTLPPVQTGNVIVCSEPTKAQIRNNVTESNCLQMNSKAISKEPVSAIQSPLKPGTSYPSVIASSNTNRGITSANCSLPLVASESIFSNIQKTLESATLSNDVKAVSKSKMCAVTATLTVGQLLPNSSGLETQVVTTSSIKSPIIKEALSQPVKRINQSTISPRKQPMPKKLGPTGPIFPKVVTTTAKMLNTAFEKETTNGNTTTISHLPSNDCHVVDKMGIDAMDREISTRPSTSEPELLNTNVSSVNDSNNKHESNISICTDQTIHHQPIENISTVVTGMCTSSHKEMLEQNVCNVLLSPGATKKLPDYTRYRNDVVTTRLANHDKQSPDGLQSPTVPRTSASMDIYSFDDTTPVSPLLVDAKDPEKAKTVKSPTKSKGKSHKSHRKNKNGNKRGGKKGQSQSKKQNSSGQSVMCDKESRTCSQPGLTNESQVPTRKEYFSIKQISTPDKLTLKFHIERSVSKEGEPVSNTSNKEPAIATEDLAKPKSASKEISSKTTENNLVKTYLDKKHPKLKKLLKSQINCDDLDDKICPAQTSSKIEARGDLNFASLTNQCAETPNVQPGHDASTNVLMNQTAHLSNKMNTDTIDVMRNSTDSHKAPALYVNGNKNRHVVENMDTNIGAASMSFKYMSNVQNNPNNMAGQQMKTGHNALEQKCAFNGTSTHVPTCNDDLGPLATQVLQTSMPCGVASCSQIPHHDNRPVVMAPLENNRCDPIPSLPSHANQTNGGGQRSLETTLSNMNMSTTNSSHIRPNDTTLPEPYILEPISPAESISPPPKYSLSSPPYKEQKRWIKPPPRPTSAPPLQKSIPTHRETYPRPEILPRCETQQCSDTNKLNQLVSPHIPSTMPGTNKQDNQQAGSKVPTNGRTFMAPSTQPKALGSSTESSFPAVQPLAVSTSACHPAIADAAISLVSMGLGYSIKSPMPYETYTDNTVQTSTAGATGAIPSQVHHTRSNTMDHENTLKNVVETQKRIPINQNAKQNYPLGRMEDSYMQKNMNLAQSKHRTEDKISELSRAAAAYKPTSRRPSAGKQKASDAAADTPPIKKLKLMCNGITFERTIENKPTGSAKQRKASKSASGVSNSPLSNSTVHKPLGNLYDSAMTQLMPSGQSMAYPSSSPQNSVSMQLQSSFPASPLYKSGSYGGYVYPCLTPQQLYDAAPARQPVLSASPLSPNPARAPPPPVSPLSPRPLGNGYDAPLELTTKRTQDRHKERELERWTDGGAGRYDM